MKSILVTGGAGYIGSHTVLQLLNNGYEVTVVDNLSNSSSRSLAIVEELAGKKVSFVELDILDKMVLASLFQSQNFDSVIHFAGLKAVGESLSLIHI